MNDPQTINQLFFTIFGLILACLFVGTLRIGTDDSATQRFWRLSVGARAGAFLAWAAMPVFGAVSTVVANGLFVFSAGCLALLFRSWRVTIGQRLFITVSLLSMTVGVMMELLRQVHPDFWVRMVLIGSTSLGLTLWGLTELVRRIQQAPDDSLKLVAAVVLLQIALSVAAIVSSVLHADRSIVFVTDNGTQSMYLIWCTMAVHIVIYLFISSHLYRHSLTRELAVVRQNHDLSALLSERERLLASLIISNRIASTGALSASVAHEMSQPLLAAMMTLGLARREIERPSAAGLDLRPMVADALDHLGRASTVLNHLRSLFRQGPVQAGPCKLHDLVVQTILLVRSRLDEAGIVLHYAPAPAITAKVVPGEIQQVLINLINNAIDAFSDPAQTIKVIDIALAEKTGRVCMAVADNGQGIRAELADSLFELARSDKPDGMGVGLWISRYIIEDHHRGRLYVDRDHAPGARFVIELPT